MYSRGDGQNGQDITNLIKYTTKVLPYKDFLNEEDEYHIKYYEKNGKMPGCHVYKKLY